MKEQDLQELIDWMRTQPEPVQRVMEKFPPRCTVRANIKLLCPAPGKTAKVVSYRERDHENDITVCVGKGDRAIECEMGWLEVVGYESGVTPEMVRTVCGLEEEK